MRAQYRPIIIFSVNQSKLCPAINLHNDILTSNLMSDLGIQFQYSLGVYNGQQEKSYILSDTPDNRRFVADMATLYNQECILSMDNEGRGILEYPTHKENIGFLKVHLEKPQGDHTQVLGAGQYFTFE